LVVLENSPAAVLFFRQDSDGTPADSV